MANHLDDNISPDDVTPDNIQSYDAETTSVIDQIQFTDMVNFSTELANLPNYKTNLLSQKHLKGTNLPGTAFPGTVFFHVEVPVQPEQPQQPVQPIQPDPEQIQPDSGSEPEQSISTQQEQSQQPVQPEQSGQ